MHRLLARFVAFGLVVAATSTTSCCKACHCPAFAPTVTVAVQGGDLMDAVVITFTGTASGTFNCRTPTSNTQVVCDWPPGSVDPGNYTLHVASPGFEPVDLQATVTVTRVGDCCECCCPETTVSPATVSLVAVDGGSP